MSWAFNGKILFNPDPSKKARKVIFSCKANKHFQTKTHLGNCSIQITNAQKYSGFYLYAKLKFNKNHRSPKINKVNKAIVMLRKSCCKLPISRLIILQRPHLDYGNIIHHQPNHKQCSFYYHSIYKRNFTK